MEINRTDLLKHLLTFINRSEIIYARRYNTILFSFSSIHHSKSRKNRKNINIICLADKAGKKNVFNKCVIKSDLNRPFNALKVVKLVQVIIYINYYGVVGNVMSQIE